MKKYNLSLVLCLTVAITLSGQYQAERYLPSKLYDRGEYEIHLFNNYFSWGEDRGPNKFRYNFFTSNLQLLYGISTKLNVGLDLKLRSVTQSLGTKDYVFEALKWSNSGRYNAQDASGYRRSGLTAVGLRWKTAPFEAVPNFSIQQTFYIPIGKELEGNGGNGFIDWGGYSFYTQLYYDHNITEKLSLFAETDLIVENIGKAMFGKADGYYQFSTPVSLIFSYFPNSKHTIYGLVNVAPQWGTTVLPSDHQKTRSYTPYNQYGLGYKYAISNKILAEIIWTRFYNSSATARIYTYNLGIRYFVYK